MRLVPTPSRETTAAAPGVVGRGGELARLADLLSGAGLGSASVAVIRGETGCGKTHLLNAVAEELTWRTSLRLHKSFRPHSDIRPKTPFTGRPVYLCTE